MERLKWAIFRIISGDHIWVVALFVIGCLFLLFVMLMPLIFGGAPDGCCWRG